VPLLLPYLLPPAAMLAPNHLAVCSRCLQLDRPAKSMVCHTRAPWCPCLLLLQPVPHRAGSKVAVGLMSMYMSMYKGRRVPCKAQGVHGERSTMFEQLLLGPGFGV
jgi:hypothetical protein